MYTTIYSGLGRLLRTAGSATADKPNEGDTTIASGEYSESFAGHDCIEVMLAMSFAAPATGDVVIQRSSSPSFATAEDHETIAVTASSFRSWAAGETLTGFFRIMNDSGQTMSVYLNKRIN